MNDAVASASRRRPARRADAGSGAAALPLDVKLMQAGAAVLLAAGTLLLLAGALVWTARAPWFEIRSVGVDGDLAHHSAATLAASVASHLGGSYFTLDLARARAAFEAVPWVRRATVQRVWPNRLRVQLQEHRAAALWERDRGDDLLVNTEGEVFEVNLGDVDDEGLPRLRGPDERSADVLALYRRLVPVLEPVGRSLPRLALSEHGSWRATLDDRSVIELGRGSADEVVARTERFVATLPQVLQRNGRALAHADLRHRDGYAVRFAAQPLNPATPAGQAASR